MLWYFEDKPLEFVDALDFYGFVYVIENLNSGRKYIGKKFFWSKKTKIIKGKKRRSLVESDWRDYWGSSVELLEDIKKLGKDQFKRTVLKLCDSKTECAYWELKHQMDNDVLLSEEYYNSWIMARVRKSNLRKQVRKNGRRNK